MTLYRSATPFAFLLLVAVAVWLPAVVVAAAVVLLLGRGGRWFARVIREADQPLGPEFAGTKDFRPWPMSPATRVTGSSGPG